MGRRSLPAVSAADADVGALVEEDGDDGEQVVPFRSQVHLS